jgi:hypothetical protein
MLREQAEQRAERVLAKVPSWIWDGETLPVPVEDVADSVFGLCIREAPDLRAVPGAPDLPPSQSLSGLLLPRLGEIWVNAAEAREWPGRRRFTVGHELGHWCMHRSGAGAIWCRSTSVSEDDRGAFPPEEAEANFFAAALLMPARLVRREYRRLRGREDRFEQLCSAFGASGAAMGRRLRAVV